MTTSGLTPSSHRDAFVPQGRTRSEHRCVERQGLASEGHGASFATHSPIFMVPPEMVSRPATIRNVVDLP